MRNRFALTMAMIGVYFLYIHKSREIGQISQAVSDVSTVESAERYSTKRELAYTDVIIYTCILSLT